MANPTHATWIARATPAARRAIAACWRNTYRYALLDAGPIRSKARQHFAAESRSETHRARERRFYDLRLRLSERLAAGDLVADDARAMISSSGFAADLHVTSSQAETIDQLAALLGTMR